MSATSRIATNVIIQADPENAGYVYVGDSSVAAGQCIKLQAASGIDLNADDDAADEDTVVIDLSDLWIDGDTSGDKVNISVIDEISTSYNR